MVDLYLESFFSCLSARVFDVDTYENESGFIKVDISPRIKNEFEIQPVRWVVERTFGWMTWSRRLSKDYEIRTFFQENICIISNLQTLLRRF